ncbi:hypothetical protein T492DRAFT_479663 [Pavlovales sp. CCMP2436]|nr:hypothetical protein T492DRAFT_479663 [Pavlovales sp. CCMP2436]
MAARWTVSLALAVLALSLVACRAAHLPASRVLTARRCVTAMAPASSAGERPMRPSGEFREVKKLWRSRRSTSDDLALASLANGTRASRVNEVLRAPRRMRGEAVTQGVDKNMRSDLRLTISGGEQKGRRLQVPDVYIRPMMAQVRQAMFSMLGELVELGPSTRALDLFSGSGCVGLETLSRGCEYVASVDMSHKCADVMRINAKNCGYEDRHQVVVAKAEHVLADPAKFNVKFPFDLITLTPPYEEVRVNI